MYEVNNHSYVESLKNFLALGEQAIKNCDDGVKKLIIDFLEKIKLTIFSDDISSADQAINIIEKAKNPIDIENFSYLDYIPNQIKSIIIDRSTEILNEEYLKEIFNPSIIDDFMVISKNINEYILYTQEDINKKVSQSTLKQPQNKLKLQTILQEELTNYFFNKIKSEIPENTRNLFIKIYDGSKSMDEFSITKKEQEKGCTAISNTSLFQFFPSLFTEYSDNILKHNNDFIKDLEEKIDNSMKLYYQSLLGNIDSMKNIKNFIFSNICSSIIEESNKSECYHLVPLLIVLSDITKDPEILKLSESLQSSIESIKNTNPNILLTSS